MKLPRKLQPAYVLLCTLFRVVPFTGLDNWLRTRFGIRLINPEKPPAIKAPRMRLNGMVRDHNGCFLQCSEMYVDFDLCRKGAGGHCYFEEGFMRIGNMVSPAREKQLPFFRFDEWVPARGRSSLPGVVHQEPVLLVDKLRTLNPVLALRRIYAMLYCLDASGMRIEDAVLLLCNYRPEQSANEIAAALFNLKRIGDMRGVHLFRNALGLAGNSWRGWQCGESSQLLRRHLLPAFDIPGRRRSEDAGRITLVSRQNYEWARGSVNLLTRKIGNEDEIVAALHSNFPDADVQLVRLEQLPMVKQLRLIHETDVLIGMHGAALGFTLLLPENAGLLELHPAHFFCSHYFWTFYVLAVSDGIHYRRWINFNPKREYCSGEWAEHRARYPSRWWDPKRDFTEVPPQAVVQRVKALRRCIRRGHTQGGAAG